MGIPLNLAHRVARGERTLSSVLEQMAIADRAAQLERLHGLDRAMAFQVAMGHLDLQDVLFRRRMAAHLERNLDRSALDEAHRAGRPLALALFGNRWVEGALTALDRYQVVMDEGPPIHKLEIKLAVEPGLRRRVRRAIRYDGALRSAPRRPAARPQDRYRVSQRTLYRLLDEQREVAVTLLEGEILRGALTWIGRWELGLRLKGGAGLVVMRHALARLDRPHG